MKKTRLVEILLLALALIFLIGEFTILGACGPRADGTYMNCHHAEIALKWLSGGMVLCALAALFVNHKTIKVISSCLILNLGLVAAIIPQNVIHLCAMTTMHCHAVMRPAAIVLSVCIMLLAMIELLVILLSKNREKRA